MTVAGIILAGGASRRMGSPKALLDYRGETFLDRLIRIFSAHCGSVTVVLGHDPDAIRAGVQRDAHFEYNEHHALGQLTSLQCGLRAANAGAYLYTPVDYPGVEESTVRRMLDADDALFVIPRYRGQRGHPILFSHEVRDEFLSLPANATARDVVHKHVRATRYIEVDDPGILRDVDDADAYRELLELR